MQDRYFGDVGDFGKYGLLRALSGIEGQQSLRLGIVWYLFPDESHNADGKHIGYLLGDNPEFRNCDESLYDQLRALLFDDLGINEANRCLKSAEAPGLLPKDTVFYTEPLSYAPGLLSAARNKLRTDWFAASLAKTALADLVFLDPDNGIECKIKRTAKKGPKYVYWDDIDAFIGRGQSVVVYHHLGRTGGTHAEQVETKLGQMRGRFGTRFETSAITFKRGSNRVYFIIASPERKELLRLRISCFASSGWARHFVTRQS